LECLTKEEKVEVTFSTIKEITEHGILTADNVFHKMDVLVCATGFDVSFRPRFPVIGQNGVDLRDMWKDQPDTYLSATVPQLPNYFSRSTRFLAKNRAVRLMCSLVINGPYGPYAHGSILPTIEIITRYVEKFIVKLQTENVKSFAPKQEAVDDFRQHRELFLKRTAWSSPCRSWFKGGKVDGPILMWPGSRLHFFEAIGNPRWEVRDSSVQIHSVLGQILTIWVYRIMTGHIGRAIDSRSLATVFANVRWMAATRLGT
jgi:hypothetical protein